MKILKFSISLMMASIFLLTSCRSEDEEVITPDENQNETISNFTANLMSNVALNDGSVDNILDNASCFTIQLPVTVFVADLEIIVDSEADFETIEDLFDESDEDDDEVQFVFPITITLSNFTEVTVNSAEELQTFVDQCPDENIPDDDIECVDFQFPLTFSIFDENNEIIETITINTDASLYLFLEALEEEIVALNFPVTLLFQDGTSLQVFNVDELEDAIEQAEDDCDEDDDNDFDDDDCLDCTTDDLEEALTECPDLMIEELEINDIDLTNQFVDFSFSFFTNGELTVESDVASFEGTWNLSGEGENIVLTIDLPALEELDGEWLLEEIEDEDEEILLVFSNDDDYLEFICGEDDDDEPTDELEDILSECIWVGVPNGNDDFNIYEFTFDDDGELIVFNTVTQIETEGSWDVFESNGNLILEMTIGGELTIFSNEWIIDTLEDNFIEAVDELGSTLIMEQDCS